MNSALIAGLSPGGLIGGLASFALGVLAVMLRLAFSAGVFYWPIPMFTPTGVMAPPALAPSFAAMVRAKVLMMRSA